MRSTPSELVENILSLIVENPKISANVVNEFLINPVEVKNLAIVFAMIGFDCSKRLFKWIAHRHWIQFENYASQVRLQLSAAEVTRILTQFHSALVKNAAVKMQQSQPLPPPPPLKKWDEGKYDKFAEVEFKILDFLRKESPEIYLELVQNNLVDPRLLPNSCSRN